MSSERATPRISLLITDLDNTLYDWVGIWYSAFSAFLEYLVEASGISQSTLEAEIRAIHQTRGTTEYSYLLDEIPSLRELHPGEDIATIYSEGVRRYREARRKSLFLYAGVEPTLAHLKARNVRVVAYTESLAYYSSIRLKKLGLDGVIDFLYSPEDNEFPEGVSSETLRSEPNVEYQLMRTVHRHTPKGVFKPDPTVLDSILSDLGGRKQGTAYVGDNLMKDVAMAQKVGLSDVWAQYGSAQGREEYSLLRRVSHWSEDDVERERRILGKTSVVPTHTLDKGFNQLLDFFEFGLEPT